MSIRDSDEKIFRLGDLIEFHQEGRIHWGIYNNGNVIHVTNSSKPTVVSERLAKVANNRKRYKKNLLDHYETPFPPEEIIKRASKELGKTWFHVLLSDNSEHFVCKMRYDIEDSDPEALAQRLEVDIASKYSNPPGGKYDLDYKGRILRKGDLIEFDRGLFKHWGIYNKGKVIHVTEPSNHSGRFSASVNTSRAIRGDVNAKVISERLKEVANGDKFYKNNLLDIREKPFDPEKIVQKASDLIGQPWEYHFIRKNCEHFVCKMRYGLDVSQQVNNARAFLSAGIGITATMAAVSFFSSGALAAGAACLFLGSLMSKNMEDEAKKNKRDN